MLFSPDDKASNQSFGVQGQMGGPQVAFYQQPPPSYFPPVANGYSPYPNSLTFKTKPNNFYALHNKHDSIKGEFVVDPSISIPPFMLPPLEAGETEADRKNLSLRSKYSSVRAEIWLLGSQSGMANVRRTTIALASTHGSIHAQVQSLYGAAPFSLTAKTPNESVHLAIPRSFQGLLFVSTRYGSVHLSDAIAGNAAQLNQLKGMQRYFIGDLHLFGEGQWHGDQMELESTHGSIHVKYVDEVVARDK